jgi:hypothetical protein
MISDLDNFYLQYPEPIQGCFLALRDIILAQDNLITAEWKYRLPFFCYKGKMFSYLWIDKKTNRPYIGIVEGKHINHPDLHFEKRTRIKTIQFEPSEDLPVETIANLIQQALDLYRSGLIKIK